MIEADMSSLNNLMKDFSKVMYKYPVEINKFMNSEATKTQKAIEKKELPQYKVQQNKSMKDWIPFKKGRYKKYSERDGLRSWYILKNKVWYERLVNAGHKIKRDGKVVGVVHPTNFIEKGVKGYEPTLFQHFESLIRSILNNG